ncbi:MAG: phosphotransferase [Betaproteobacteria bacterium]|nr:phosphotransferase [Betaproteobacteria bacterium]
MSPPQPPHADARLQALSHWLAGLPAEFGVQPASLRPASDDASFRRYFRVDAGAAHAGSLIVMDAPPPQEDCRPFVHAAAVMARAGLSVPRVLVQDLDRGFLLLDDFGSTTYLHALDERTAPTLYGEASAALVRLQQASRPGVFAPYDRALLARELDLYPQWYVARHRGVTLSPAEQQILEVAFQRLSDAALAQPQVIVHRDYHSRNLMLLPGEANPGVLDFQDAVIGAHTYDLVSLLRDAYKAWPEEFVLDQCIRHWERARRAGLPVPDDFGEFYRQFEWMGMQRHLKVLGIFARLCHRDGKPRYLADIPLVLDYLLKAARRYRDLDPLVRVLERVEGESRATGYTF